MAGAGQLRGRAHFQKREVVDDGAGNEVSGEFVTQFTAAVGFKAKLGGEEVMAARLDGIQPYVVTVYQSPQSRLVDPEWRIVDARDPSRIFAITAIHDPDQRGAMFEMLVKQGEPS